MTRRRLAERLSLHLILLNIDTGPGDSRPGQEVRRLHLLALSEGGQLGGGEGSAPAVEVRHLPREILPVIVLSGLSSNQMKSKYFQISLADLDIRSRSQRLFLSVMKMSRTPCDTVRQRLFQPPISQDLKKI